MSERSHLRLTKRPGTHRYKSPAMVVSGEFPLPPRDRSPHAQKLTKELLVAANEGVEKRQQQGLMGRPQAFVYTFRSDPGHELALESLERKQNGIELQGVTYDGQVQVATVRVPDGELRVFFRLLKEYQKKVDKRSGTYRNKNLIESIAGIRLTAVRDLWQDPSTFPASGQSIWWEVWVRNGPGGGKATHKRFRDAAVAAGMRVSDQYIGFPERVVTLAYGTPEHLGSSLDLLAEIAEVRRAKELASDYMTLPRAFQREYVADAESRIVPPPPDAPAVSLLDTGVNRGHPLIAVALDEADAQALREPWGTADHDTDHQHGTTMAGVALYGCLTDVFNGSGPYPLRHRLESLKILPPGGANDPELYGALTQEAVALAEIQAPVRNRAVCLTVTSNTDDKALPSSWSAAVDQLCSGQLDNARRLLFVAAGNVREELLTPAYAYHDWNCTSAGIEDPGQSWNAVTVGAMTEKVFVTDPQYRDWTPLASTGDLCPVSRTSLAWPEDLHAGWPLKPDIVMEGGNYAEKGGDRAAIDDLCILTTVVRPDGRRLSTTSDTSPATAAAARLGAILWSHYPTLWPETVRGLMVHSARWTEAMVRRFPGDGKAAVQRRLRCYGYGVPRLAKALWSAGNAVTMIYEGDLQPYDKVDGRIETKEMHLHQLPWPREALYALGDVDLTMRVTLSYFVEPSPGRIGWDNRHRYQSHGLRFDVIRPVEDETQFRQRISRAEWDDPEQRPEGVQDRQRWVVGANGRTHGSLHCDWWTGSAAELAASNRIAVYPVTGWWRERPHLERWSSRARYSLIVTVETPKVDVDLYSMIETEVSVTTEIEP